MAASQPKVMEINSSVVDILHDDRKNNIMENIKESDLAPRSDIVENAEVYLYEITEKVQLGELSKIFLHKIGVIFCYMVLCLHLYGTESTFLAAIAKSTTSVVCGDSYCFKGNKTVRCNCFDGNVTEPCSTIAGLSVIHTYRIALTICILLCTPFIFFNLAMTKWLQILAIGFRWVALLTMVTLAIIKIEKGEGSITQNLAVCEKLPNFLGVTLIGFMCQHSITNIITPLSNKKHLKASIIFVYTCVVLIISLVVMTATYAFEENDVQDLYTSNFSNPLVFRYILELFPVFTLPMNIPIVGITLRENLKTLFLSRKEEEYGIVIRRIMFPLLVIIPSAIIAYSTYNVGMIAGYTGAYAGAIIQYVVPAVLVYCARKKATHVFGNHENIYRSPFHHPIWVYFVLIWYLICFIVVTFLQRDVIDRKYSFVAVTS